MKNKACFALLKLVKDETKRKYGERNILSAFIRFVKFSKVRSPCLDSHSFSLYLHAIGISTVPLKSNIEEGPSNLTMLEQLFKAFDRDGDGLISSSDFADTVQGLDSETMLKMRTKAHANFMKPKLCKDTSGAFLQR